MTVEPSYTLKKGTAASGLPVGHQIGTPVGHTSAQAVYTRPNSSAARLYPAGYEKLLDMKLKGIAKTASLEAFLEKYGEDSTRGRGMRVLLLHWLEIGRAIRLAHGA